MSKLWILPSVYSVLDEHQTELLEKKIYGLVLTKADDCQTFRPDAI